MRQLLTIAFLCLLLSACGKLEKVTVVQGGTGIENNSGGSTDPGSGTTFTPPTPNADAIPYLDIHDPIADAGQFYMPEVTRLPKKIWTCVNVQNASDRNNLGVVDRNGGLQYHLLCQSLAGLVNRALEEGRTDVGVWLETKGEAYDLSRAALGPEIGRQTGVELATKDYGPVDGIPVNLRSLFDGYVLTDLSANPESGTVATVAAHVFNALIVDVRDQAYFEEQGYRMLYDAREKTTRDAWSEFKDRCSNKALVVMPVQTGELREFAIRNKLFCINLNKRNGTSAGGQNVDIFDEVLDWLEPCAPVLGWEQGVGEDAFVARVSRSGKLMLAADWSYNHSLTSANARNRQSGMLAKVLNPRNIDYAQSKHFVSFFLSDGDNYQWVMGGGFVNDYYRQPAGTAVRMSYGLCSQALSELAPAQHDRILELQEAGNTLMECFGGGYFYIDTFSEAGNRSANLKRLAERTAVHMRQHRLKVLHVIAWDVLSPASREACQAFVDANDQLEGIVAIQYSPYNGGKGELFWCRNKKGYDIPVVTAKYSLWKRGNGGQGSPVKIAARMQRLEEGNSHAFVCVHAWSDFSGLKGAAAALDCIEKAGDGFRAVNAQELIWRIRMQEKKDQTLQYLATIK